MASERALRSITRLHARSSTARGWYGLAAARQASNVWLPSSSPHYHSTTAGKLCQAQIFSFVLFPLKKSLRVSVPHVPLVSGKALTKLLLLYCKPYKREILYNGTYCTTLALVRYLWCKRVYQSSLSFSREERELRANYAKFRIKKNRNKKLCKNALAVKPAFITLLLYKLPCSFVVFWEKTVLFTIDLNSVGKEFPFLLIFVVLYGIIN